MSLKVKISARERWVVALAPALAIGFVYFFWLAGSYEADLAKAQARAAEATQPLPPPAASPTLAQAKAVLADLKRSIADREAKVVQLETKIAAAPVVSGAVAAADGRDPARAIERVEAVFAKNGLTPLISESANEGNGGDQAPSNLLAVLAPKGDLKIPGLRGPRVWHCIFDDQISRFERALRELATAAPTVVPLSLNLVYNPDNDGESRLLELWLVY